MQSAMVFWCSLVQLVGRTMFGAVGAENDCRIYGSVFTGFTAVFASNGSDLGIFVTFSLDA